METIHNKKRTTICGQDSQYGGAPKVLLITINIIMVTIVIVNMISRANLCHGSCRLQRDHHYRD